MRSSICACVAREIWPWTLTTPWRTAAWPWDRLLPTHWATKRASADTAPALSRATRLVPRQISFVTSCRARVGRVTPCAPRPADSFPNGAHGVTRPTTSRNLFVTVLVPSHHGPHSPGRVGRPHTDGVSDLKRLYVVIVKKIIESVGMKTISGRSVVPG